MVSTFGVERVKAEGPGQEGQLDWTRFRTFARLDKKTDESLSRYFRGFTAMCRRVCQLRPAAGDGEAPQTSVWECQAAVPSVSMMLNSPVDFITLKIKP